MKRIEPAVHTRAPTMAAQRGVTLVSVMLLVVSLLTLGLLVVRSSVREVTQAGQLVARERALMVAQAAIDLASAHYRSYDSDALDQALQGFYSQGMSCNSEDMDCIPGDDPLAPTGQRNSLLAGQPVDCSGRVCMRQGAVVQLPPSGQANDVKWCAPSGGVPFNQLVPDGDPEAQVCVWIRNNAADALGTSGSQSWVQDGDGRVVLTAMATVRNTTVTVEQEVMLAGSLGPQVWRPQTPDEGYGGGHNNDNSAVSVCTDDFVAAESNG